MKSLIIVWVSIVCSNVLHSQVITLYEAYAGTEWDKMVYDYERDELWLGSSSFSGGEKMALIDSDRKKQSLEGLFPDLAIQNVSSLNYYNGKVYLGSYGQAMEIDTKTRDVTTLGSVPSANYVELFYNPIDERVTIGNFAVNASYWDGNSWKMDQSIGPILNHSYSDENKELLMLGTFKKLFKRSTTGFETLNFGSSGIPDLPYNKIVHGKGEEIFMSTVDQGFVHFDGQNWRIINSGNSSLKPFDINDVVVDKEGRLWMAHTFGISFYDGNQIVFFDLLKEFHLNYIEMESIAVDNDGHIWSGSSAGLVELVMEPSMAVNNSTLLEVYPNPVLTTLRINTNYNIDGLMLISSDGTEYHPIMEFNQIDCSAYNSGIYFLHILTQDHQRIINKIIKL